MSINENLIRELAYQIWESEGRPDGQAERHWSLAFILAATEMQATVNEEPHTNESQETTSEPHVRAKS